MEHTVFYLLNIALLLTYDSGLKVVSLTQKLKKSVYECFGKSPASIVTKLLYQKVV